MRLLVSGVHLFLQADAQRRKAVFDRLLASYRAGQASYLDLKQLSDARAVELARYKGECLSAADAMVAAACFC